MKNIEILVPTDLSELGNIAFSHAAQFVGQFGGSVTPLYVFEEEKKIERILGLDDPGAYKKPGMLHRIKEHLHEKAAGFIPSAHLNEARIITGAPAAEIVAAGQEMDFIIMTGNKRTGIKRISLGSVAQKVAARSHTPVIITGSDCDLEHFHKLLVLTDFSERSLQVVPHAKALMAVFPELKTDFVHFVNVGYFTAGNNKKIIAAAEAEIEKVAAVQFEGFEERVDTHVFITSTSPAEAIINLTFSRNYSL
ncbi:MAG: universal stress protein, partial [Cyclonatronaceae bacterium]